MEKNDLLHLLLLSFSLFSLSFLFFSNTVTQVHVSLGSGDPLVAKVPRMFSLAHAIALMALTALGTVSLMRLTRGAMSAEKQQQRHEIALRALHGDEKALYALVAQKKECLQKDLVYESRFPKAKVTRILDRLEQKGLVAKRPYGNTNRIVLQE